MRTTLDIEDDVLAAAKERAKRENLTAGQLISRLLRRAMTQPVDDNPTANKEPPAFHGFRPFPTRGTVVSDATVNRLRDGQGPEACDG
jgi:hypothetical protein